MLRVGAGSERVREFEVNGGFHSVVLTHGANPEEGRGWLAPEVRYEGLKNPIHLADMSSIEVEIDQPENDPVIRVDQNGMVQALRAGKQRL